MRVPIGIKARNLSWFGPIYIPKRLPQSPGQERCQSLSMECVGTTSEAHCKEKGS